MRPSPHGFVLGVDPCFRADKQVPCRGLCMSYSLVRTAPPSLDPTDDLALSCLWETLQLRLVVDFSERHLQTLRSETGFGPTLQQPRRLLSAVRVSQRAAGDSAAHQYRLPAHQCVGV